jgi:uncharacterized protein (TIGR00725 family)
LSAERYVAVVGPGDASPAELAVSEELGAALASAGAVVVCGGLGGVMEAACRGAKSRRGLTVLDRSAANGWVDVAIPTGMGELRNGLIVRAADAIVAVGGGAGTLSEIAFALKAGRPVIGIGTFTLDGVAVAGSAEEAAALAVR